MLSTLDLAKKISIRHNVSIRVLDQNGQVISEHTGHNAATNSMITGVAHYRFGRAGAVGHAAGIAEIDDALAGKYFF